MVAAPKCKAYGILSVTSQLYSTPRLAFKIPPTVFQPQPDVDSALVVFDFPRQRPHFGINECHLRTVLRSSFQMRRKMLRQSLKELCKTQNVILPDSWGTLRPEALSPQQFVELTKLIFGEGATPAGASVVLLFPSLPTSLPFSLISLSLLSLSHTHSLSLSQTHTHAHTHTHTHTHTMALALLGVCVWCGRLDDVC